MTAASARSQPARLREILDFEEAFTAVDASDCSPVLARYDRIIEFERQRACYDELPLTVLDKGHITGSLATARLREHVVGILSEVRQVSG